LYACLILDLITGQAVLTKWGMYFFDYNGSPIEDVEILSGVICVRYGNDRTRFPEVDVSVEVDQNPFLPSPLLRSSVHEEVVADNVVSRTTSPPLVKRKKDIKERKKLNINYFLLFFFGIIRHLLF
jgi:hypothetical protein